MGPMTNAPELPSAMPKAAASIRSVIHRITPEQFAARTPCEDFDVRALANHLLYWAPVLIAAARKEDPPRDRPPESEAALADGDWQQALDVRLTELVSGWSLPEAWEGTTRMTSSEFPAAMAGSIALVDVVVHGWDFARATGQDFVVEPEVADAVLDIVRGMAEQGRKMGAFGPEVPVPDTAPPLDRALGLVGRDPGWQPGDTETGRHD